MAVQRINIHNEKARAEEPKVVDEKPKKQSLKVEE